MFLTTILFSSSFSSIAQSKKILFSENALKQAEEQLKQNAENMEKTVFEEFKTKRDRWIPYCENENPFFMSISDTTVNKLLIGIKKENDSYSFKIFHVTKELQNINIVDQNNDEIKKNILIDKNLVATIKFEDFFNESLVQTIIKITERAEKNENQRYILKEINPFTYNDDTEKYSDTILDRELLIKKIKNLICIIFITMDINIMHINIDAEKKILSTLKSELSFTTDRTVYFVLKKNNNLYIPTISLKNEYLNIIKKFKKKEEKLKAIINIQKKINSFKDHTNNRIQPTEEQKSIIKNFLEAASPHYKQLHKKSYYDENQVKNFDNNENLLKTYKKYFNDDGDIKSIEENDPLEYLEQMKKNIEKADKEDNLSQIDKINTSIENLKNNIKNIRTLVKNEELEKNKVATEKICLDNKQKLNQTELEKRNYENKNFLYKAFKNRNNTWNKKTLVILALLSAGTFFNKFYSINIKLQRK